MKRTIFLLVGLLIALHTWADEKITFRATAPSDVIEGDRFTIQFSVNNTKTSDPKLAETDDFKVLYANGKSVQQQTQIINGKRSSSTSVIYTYTLSAQRTGKHTIAGATVEYEGKIYTSNSVTINVLPPSKASQTSPSSGGQQTQRQGQSSQGTMHTQQVGSEITSKDLFINTTANKRKVYEQEAILLTYKVFSLVNLIDLQGKMPDLQGFHSQEVPLGQQKTFKLEHHNGYNYGTVVWSQYVMYPQQAGELTIPAINFEGTVVQQDRNIDPIEAFFGGGIRKVEVKKSITTPAITLQVLPLPTRPANFSGAVGQFSLTSTLDKKELSTNEALNLRISLSGVGNMKLIKTPEIKFPKSFETYPPKTTDKTKLTQEGLSGTKTFEYLAIPRRHGSYTIPSLEFIFFDPKSEEYKTITTEAYQIEVEKSEGDPDHYAADPADKKELALLGEDIHYIKLHEGKRYNEESAFFGSLRYYLSYLIPLLLFILILILFRRRAIANSNEVKMRGKKANKVAGKRLQSAKKLLHSNHTALFYDEVLKALWGYMSDKLNIPVAKLNKENIIEVLAAKEVSEELTNAFIETLNECEFARFAPGDPNAAMDKIFHTASQVISQMESSIKR